MYIRRSERRYRPRAVAGQQVPERVYLSYAVVASYRDQQGRPRQRTLLGLGRHPSVESKLAALELERIRLSERHEAAARNPARAALATITARSLTRLEGEMARLQEIADQLRRRGAGPA